MSAMNCKPQDLAIVVCSGCPFLGRIVQVTRVFRTPAGFAWQYIGGQRNDARCPNDFFMRVFFDASLRPIRDNPGADETLDWLDVPGKVAA